MGLFSGKEMTDIEIKAILGKLREEYIRSAETHGASLFNVEALNQRYLEALRKRVDIKVFLAAEVQAYNEIVHRIAEKESEVVRAAEAEQKREEESFSRKADDILDKFEKMIEKYPSIEMSPHSSNEINHLYGGLKELAGCVAIVRSLFTGTGDYSLEMAAKALDELFTRHTTEIGDRFHDLFQDYILAFLRPNSESEAKKMEQNTLKECGFFLNDSVTRLQELVANSDIVQPGAPVTIPELIEKDYPRIAKTFAGKTRGEVLTGALAYAEAMVRDFRLASFKKS